MTEAAERPVIYKPHEGAQTEFHTRDEDFVLFGGSKFPGKTHALLFEATRQVDKPGYKALLLRRTFPRLQEMMDRARLYFPKMGATWEGEARRWRFPSGASIAFGHCEHEDSKYNYQGHEYAFIGFDQLEEFTESQVRFIMAQNRTSDPSIRCCVRATANPGGIGHWWIKRKFIDGKKSRETHSESFGEYDGKRLFRTSVYIPATIYDNPTGLAANPQYLAFLRSLPEQERKAYEEGDWNAFSTDCIFDSAGMAAQQRMVVEASWVGLLQDAGESPEFVLDEKGRLTVWEHPVEGRRYMVTSDIAKGPVDSDGSEPELESKRDYCTALVFDRFKREVVARWYGRCDPTEFGKVLFGLGLYYNNALLAPEAWPGPGIATVAKLVSLGYPNLYHQKVWDGEARVEKEQVGWYTTEGSRDEAIATLQYHVKKSRIVIRDQLTLDEMYSFIRKARAGRKVRIEARSGCHDDLVTCMWIAAYIFEFDPGHDKIGPSKAEAPIQAQTLVRLPSSRRQRMIAGMRGETL